MLHSVTSIIWDDQSLLNTPFLLQWYVLRPSIDIAFINLDRNVRISGYHTTRLDRFDGYGSVGVCLHQEQHTSLHS